MGTHENKPDKQTGRRAFLQKSAVATGIVWTAPVVMSLNQPIAAATGSAVCPYTFCFDGGTTEGWSIDNTAGSGNGLWQVNSGRSTSPSFSLHYGNGLGGTYETGGTNSGTVTSPSFLVPAAGGDLTFNIWREIESYPSGNWDEFSVSILPSGNVEYAVAVDGGTGGVFQPISIDLGAYAGQSIQVVFAFDTGDGNFNNFEGIWVDDVTVPCTVPPASGGFGSLTTSERSTLGGTGSVRGGPEPFFPPRQPVTNRERRDRERSLR